MTEMDSSSCAINDLHHDCLREIIGHLNLLNVFLIMRVCKNWESMCRSVLNSWKVLHFCPKWYDSRDYPWKNRITLTDGWRFADSEKDKLQVASLKHLISLRVLTAAYSHEIHWKNVSDIIANCCQTLIRLEWTALPQRQGVSYPKLSSLTVVDCNSLTAATATACPSLMHIKLNQLIPSADIVGFLNALPCHQIETFAMKPVLVIDHLNFAGELVNVIRKWSNLQSLSAKITLTCKDVSTQTRFRDKLNPLFTSLSNLRHVNLDLSWSTYPGDKIFDQSSITQLIRMNKQLRSFIIKDVPVSKMTLQALSRLQQLECVMINADNDLTMDDVLSFLKSPCRGSIKKLALKNVAAKRLFKEMSRIARENGLRVFNYSGTRNPNFDCELA